MNEYDAILAGEATVPEASLSDPRQKLRQSLYGALKLDPDQVAKAKRAGTVLGVPLDVAQRNLPEVEQRAKLNEYDGLLQRSPRLAHRLQSPDFAKVAHDDTLALSALESTIEPLRGVEPGFGTIATGLGTSFVEGARRMREGLRWSFADLFGFERMREDAARRYAQARLREDVVTPEFETSTARGLYGGASSLLRVAPGIAASVLTGSPVPALAAAGVQVSTEEYGKYRLRGGTPGEAAVGALGEGTVEVATELLPMSFLVKQFGRTGAGHFLTGLLAREVPSEQLATLAQDAIDTAIANPDKTWGEYLAERPDAAYQTLLATLVQSGAIGAAHTVAARFGREARAAQAGEENAAVVGELAAGATASKLRQRDPEAFKQYVAALADGSPVQDVYVEAQVFAQALQQAGVDLVELTQVMPGVRAELDAALAANGDVRVPIEDFATHLVGTDLGNALMPHLRADPSAMSQAEAQTFMQAEAEQFRAAAEKAVAEREFDTAFKESAATVERELLAQLTQANRFTTDVNGAYAKMMASFYTVQAARLGITPEEMYVRYPLQVRAEGTAGARTMEQRGDLTFVRERAGRVYNFAFQDSAGKVVAEATTSVAEWNDAPSLKIEGVLVDEGERGTGAGGEVLDEILGQQPVLAPGAETLQGEVLGRKVAEMLTRRLGEPIYVDNGIRDLSYAEALGQMPENGSSNLSGRSWFMVWPLQPAYEQGPVAALTPEQRAVYDSIPRAKPGELTTEQRVLENRFAAELAREGLDATIERYNALPDSHGGKVLNTDTARELSPDYLADRTQSAAVHEPASWFIKRLYARKLAQAPREGEIAMVLFTAGGTGAGKTTGIGRVPRLSALASQAQIIYDTNMNGYSSAVQKVEQALTSGKRVEIVHVARDPVDALVNGALPRAERQRAQFGSGRTVPLGEHAATHRDSASTVQRIEAETQDNADVHVSYVDNARGAGQAVEVDSPPVFDYNDIEARLYAALEAERAAGRISEDTYRGFAGAHPVEVPPGGRSPVRSFSQGDRGRAGRQPESRSLSRAERLIPPLAQGQRITVGEPFVAVRYGTEADLGDRNAMTPDALLDFLTDLDDPDTAAPARRKSDQELHFFAVTASSPPVAYEPLNGRQPATGRAVGATPRDGGLWLSFPKGGAWTARPIISLPLADLRADLESRVGELWKAANQDAVAALSAILAERVDARSLGQGTRGQIAFGTELSQPSVISLFEQADLSTFLHESGHFYLEVLTDIAAQPDAPAEITTDMGRLLQWFGVADLAAWQAMPLEEKRPYHEQLARGFEAYLFEGRAPNIELQSLFGRFRAWLLNVYRQLTSLNVTLTDEVRGVFDRMLATNDEILAAQEARRMQALFETAEQAGMTPEQWTEYQALARDATQEAVDTLQRRSLRDMQWLTNAHGRELRRLQRDAAAKRKAMRAGVEAEVMAEPVNLVRGFTAQAGQRLSLASLEEAFPAENAAWRQLPKGMTARDGLPAGMVADMFGFSSVDEMVQRVLTEPPAAEKIEALTDRYMLETYGDLTSLDALNKAADAAVHNDARGRFVAAELQALEEAGRVREDTGRTVTDSHGRTRRLTVDAQARAAKAYAAEIVSRKRIRDLKPGQFTAAATRAAAAAQEALKTGRLPDAAAQKRNQLVGHYGARAAHDALGEIDRAVSYLRKFDNESTRKALDTDYVEQIDALLDRFDFRRIGNRAAERRKSLLAWVEAQREQGIEPIIDEKLLDEARRVPYRELTVEDFRGVVDAVRNIEHLGRLKRKLLTARDQREFAERVAEAEASIREHATRTLPARLESNQWRDRVRKGFNEFFAWHRKLASLFREMDGVQENGVLWNLFVRPMNEAGDREATMREQATVALSKLFTKDVRRGLRQKTFIAEINGSLSKEGRLAVALNWGNETNRQRVLEGEGWTEAQAQAVLRTLSKAEWDFVQSVWDFVDSYWPEIAAKERRVSGVAPEKVLAAPVETQHGTYRGGYYPIKYDPERSSRAESDSLAEAARQAMQGAYARATTRRGHTKARVEQVANRPVRKDFGVLFEHIGQVAHDLAWHEWLIDVNRLLRAKPIDAAIREHYGPEVLRAIKSGVEDIAAGDVPAVAITDRMLNHIRSGATIAGLGWNLTTALLQPIGLTQSMVRIGPKWVLKGMMRWLGDTARMENSVRWVGERSEFMRLRAKTLQREINEIRNKVAGDDSRIEASFFYLIQKLQLVADMPAWLGTYEKHMAAGVDEQTAIALADQAVIDAQGSGQIKDLAGVQRGGPLQKLWTNFYSFFNTTFNLTAESTARTDFTRPGSVALWATDMVLLYSVPALLSSLLKGMMKGDLDDDDEEALARRLLAEQVDYALGTMLLVREASAAVQAAMGQYTDYGGPAGVRFFKELARLGKQIEQGEADEAFFKALNNTAGVLFHYPAGQVQRTVLGAEAFSEGEAGLGALIAGPPAKR